MTIKIIEEPDIYLTREEYDRLYLAWVNSQRMTTAPVSFETYVRRQREMK